MTNLSAAAESALIPVEFGEQMFTGIVECTGTVAGIRSVNGGMALTINAGALDLRNAKEGDSIAVNGICLTATSIRGSIFTADVSHETRDLTAAGFLSPGDTVNLEQALKPESRMGGHIVTGHVDGTGTVRSITGGEAGTDFVIEAPHELMMYIAKKGSIAVSGISLTVNDTEGDTFRLTIIPHTMRATNISLWRPGTRLNLEVDVLARYVARILSMQGESATSESAASVNKPATGGLTMEMLGENGFF